MRKIALALAALLLAADATSSAAQQAKLTLSHIKAVKSEDHPFSPFSCDCDEFYLAYGWRTSDGRSGSGSTPEHNMEEGRQRNAADVLASVNLLPGQAAEVVVVVFDHDESPAGERRAAAGALIPRSVAVAETDDVLARLKYVEQLPPGTHAARMESDSSLVRTIKSIGELVAAAVKFFTSNDVDDDLGAFRIRVERTSSGKVWWNVTGESNATVANQKSGQFAIRATGDDADYRLNFAVAP